MECLQGGNTSPKASFSTLPSELRRMIWIGTFEPRILTITSHYSVVTEGRRIERSDLSIPGRWFCTFTARLGVHRLRAQINLQTGPLPVISQLALELPPPGPVALHVCRESRAVALENYEQAFGGTTQCLDDDRSVREWLKGGYGHGRIWVDFKRDTINYNGLLETGPPPVVPSLELMKVETLAVRYHLGAFNNILRSVTRQTLDFWSLETLRIYYNVYPDKDMMEDEAEEMQKKLVQTLNEERARRLPWVPPLPRVEMHACPVRPLYVSVISSALNRGHCG